MLRVGVAVHHGRFDGLTVKDTISGRSLSIKEVFVVVMKDKTELRSTEMQVSAIADTTSVADPHLTMRRTKDKVAGMDTCWRFTSSAPSVSFA
jgi:hypothetical protein